MFRHFYILVVCYVYITRILVFVLHSTLPSPYYYLGNVAEELAALVFYTLTALQFRPHAGTGYYQLLNEDIELSQL
jgi:G protein-coupled receptor 107